MPFYQRLERLERLERLILDLAPDSVLPQLAGAEVEFEGAEADGRWVAHRSEALFSTRMPARRVGRR